MSDNTKKKHHSLILYVLTYKYPTPSPFHQMCAPSFNVILEWDLESDLERENEISWFLFYKGGNFPNLHCFY
jgi:hypothetical protein